MFCYSPHGARVSGVVEETPGRLEYEVALYKEAPARKTNSSSELPVDQAVPIGTKLQLRARINPQSGKHLPKLNSLSVLRPAICSDWSCAVVRPAHAQ